MVCGADGEDTRRKTGVLEAEPVLVLPIATDINVALHFIVDADAASDQVISQVWPESIWQGREVEDAAPVHQFAVGDEFAVRAEVARTGFIGLLVEIVGALDE